MIVALSYITDSYGFHENSTRKDWGGSKWTDGYFGCQGIIKTFKFWNTANKTDIRVIKVMTQPKHCNV